MTIEDTFEEGAKLVMANAICLYKAALTLEASEQYPIANSLLILAAEEASKASVIKMKEITLQREDEEFKKVFNEHTIKLEFIRNRTIVSTILKKMFELEIDPLISKTGEITIEELDEIVKKGKRDFINWLERETYDKTELNKEIGWWKNAKAQKEEGFYVNYRKGNWLTPVRIKKKQYLNTKRNVSRFIDRIKEDFELNVSSEEFRAFREQVNLLMNKLNTMEKFL